MQTGRKHANRQKTCKQVENMQTGRTTTYSKSD